VQGRALRGWAAVVALLVFVGAGCRRSNPTVSAEDAGLAGAVPFPCGAAACSGDQYCAIQMTATNGNTGPECRPLPQACLGDPSCVCLGRAGRDLGVACADTGGHVSITYATVGLGIGALRPDGGRSLTKGGARPQVSPEGGPPGILVVHATELRILGTKSGDRSGKPPPPPPIEGLVVEVEQDREVVAWQRTNPSGTARFELPAGHYRVRHGGDVDVPPGGTVVTNVRDKPP
jgi:hypothetical protein